MATPTPKQKAARLRAWQLRQIAGVEAQLVNILSDLGISEAHTLRWQLAGQLRWLRRHVDSAAQDAGVNVPKRTL